MARNGLEIVGNKPEMLKIYVNKGVEGNDSHLRGIQNYIKC